MTPVDPAQSQGSRTTEAGGVLRRAARGSVLNFAGAVVSALAAFALTAVVTRWSSSQQSAGILFAATSLFLIASNLGALGTANGLVFFISGARGRGEIKTVGIYVRIALVPVLVVAVLTVAGMSAWAEPISKLVAADDPSSFADFLRIILLGIPFAALANIALSATRGLGTMKPTAGLDQVLRPVLQLALVALALGLGIEQGVPWGWAFGYVPVALFAWIWWRRMLGALPRQQKHVAPGQRARFWRFSGARALTGVAQVAMQRLDIILVATLAGLAAAAVYTAATRFLTIGQMAARAVSQSVQPLLGEILARGDLDAAKRLYQVSTAWLVLVTWPMYFMMIIFGASLLRVFGPGYDAGHPVLLVLCATMLLATACGMVDVVLVMAGKSSWSLANALVAFGVNLGLDLVLIPKYGIVGAALGWACAILIGNLVPLLQVRFAFGLHPFGRATVAALVLSSVSFGIVPIVTRALTDNIWVGLGCGGSAAILIWGISLWKWRRMFELPVLLGTMRKGRRRGKD